MYSTFNNGMKLCFIYECLELFIFCFFLTLMLINICVFHYIFIQKSLYYFRYSCALQLQFGIYLEQNFSYLPPAFSYVTPSRLRPRKIFVQSPRFITRVYVYITIVNTAYLFQTCNHTSFQGPAFVVPSNKKFRTSIMLLLLAVV